MTEITVQNFETEVLQQTGLLLLDFRAKWCIPCRKIAATLEKIAKERPDIKICTVDIDEQPELASAFNVMSIPTLIVYKDGKSINRVVGGRDKEGILELLGI